MKPTLASLLLALSLSSTAFAAGPRLDSHYDMAADATTTTATISDAPGVLGLRFGATAQGEHPAPITGNVVLLITVGTSESWQHREHPQLSLLVDGVRMSFPKVGRTGRATADNRIVEMVWVTVAPWQLRELAEATTVRGTLDVYEFSLPPLDLAIVSDFASRVGCGPSNR